MKFLSILTACLFVLPLCAEEPKPEAAMEYTQPEKPIETTTGHPFTIKLESNPTTGFGWQLAQSLDGKVVSLVTNTYIQRKAEPRMVGVGGHEYWTFKTVGQGQTQIAMKYVRSWEKGVPPNKTHVFNVIVK